MLTAVSQAADRLVLGVVMSSGTFGFYFIARQLVDLVARFLDALNGQMGLQVFTHIQSSTVENFRRNYYRYRLVFDALAGFAAGMGVVLAPLAVEIVFDPRYAEVARYVQILILAVLLAGPLLLRSGAYAERRLRLVAGIDLVATATLWIGLIVSVFVLDSITAALVVIALYRLPEALIYAVRASRRGQVIWWREALPLAFLLPGMALGEAILLTWNALT